MHGCGNDFIVINDAEGLLNWDALSRLAQRYCPRRLGVGADGLIAVGHSPLPGATWPNDVDFEMRYVNANGSHAEMCGNGIRCLAKFVADQQGDNRDTLCVYTGAGVRRVRLWRSGGQVTSATVSMGQPRLKAADIPTTLRSPGQEVVGALVELEHERLEVTAVNVGNPHAVVFVNEISEYLVHEVGPQLAAHAAFPQGTNVEFVQRVGPERLRMRVWERGIGETWACGTGACASVVAAVLTEHVEPQTEITVVLNGGELGVKWPSLDSQVELTGPATAVYRGELEL